MSALSELFEKVGVPLTQEAEGRFEAYYNNLISWNSRFNLTAVTERGEVNVKHFADSVAAQSFFGKGATVVDVGSGAGFPAIPLKIVREDLDITMLDALNKRVNFLQDTLALLGLEGTALHLRAEDAAKTHFREHFDVATARAVAQCGVLAEYLLPLVKVGGRAVLYKGGDVDAELQGAKGIIAKLGGKVAQVHKFDLAGNARSVIVIEKVSSTPNIYPRPNVKKQGK